MGDMTETHKNMHGVERLDTEKLCSLRNQTVNVDFFDLYIEQSSGKKMLPPLPHHHLKPWHTAIHFLARSDVQFPHSHLHSPDYHKGDHLRFCSMFRSWNVSSFCKEVKLRTAFKNHGHLRKVQDIQTYSWAV